ncbi:MAG TPA: glycosyltransferase family 4 protein [Chitinophaga sp.]|uniref:glycosyltransferase family 4 protein n=1 Tax=Chitinophaga sp. TaxID=1869181 RepID=UPI002BCA54FB|nr:glycosyltransferase family 4 protein [Chitinophaga sp.]HVI43887.1 glycosyltransferase family 4 protein [Chitinophaga sp.]
MTKQLCIASPNLVAYSETFIKDQVTYLEPEILIYQGNYPVASREEDWQLSFPFNFHIARGVSKRLAPGIFHNAYTNSLAAYLKRRNINTLLANYGTVGSSVADACAKAGVKLVVHYHGFDAYEYATLDKYKAAYQHMFRLAHTVVAVSTEMRQQLISLGAPEEKVKFIPYGINLQRFTVTDPSRNGPVLVNVGRFTPKKAPDLLIRAFKIAHDAIPEAELRMIGAGEMHESCKQLAAELGLSDAIKFLGIQSREEIVAHLHSARMYVQHSLRPASGDSEGTPLSILEASACGLPVVSTRHAGIKDAIKEEESGLLVDEGDYEEMGKAMITLLKDPARCKQMGEAGFRHISAHYNFQQQAAELKTVLLR